MSFGYHFNQNIDAVIWPKSLHVILYGFEFDYYTKHSICPDSLRKLKLGSKFNYNLSDFNISHNLSDFNISHNLSDFNISHNLSDFNISHLVALNLGDHFNQDINNVVWPNLQVLIFGQAFDRNINKVVWPPLLHTLIFKGMFNRDINVDINLRKLYQWFNFNQPINKLPLDIIDLKFGNAFNQEIIHIDWRIYNSLRILAFGENFNRICQNSDRSIDWYQLTEITFGERFNQHINNVKFTNLEIIYDHSCSIDIYNGQKNSFIYPRSLYKIIYYKCIEYAYIEHVHYIRNTGKYTKMAIH
jgi:hypothetical protein